MSDLANGIHTYMLYGTYSKASVPALNQYLLDSVDILSYWNHLPLLYFVKSRQNAGGLSAKLSAFFGEGLYVVAEINHFNMNGSLSPAAWNWFLTPAPTEKRQGSTLANLFGSPSTNLLEG